MTCPWNLAITVFNCNQSTIFFFSQKLIHVNIDVAHHIHCTSLILHVICNTLVLCIETSLYMYQTSKCCHSKNNYLLKCCCSLNVHISTTIAAILAGDEKECYLPRPPRGDNLLLQLLPATLYSQHNSIDVWI